MVSISEKDKTEDIFDNNYYYDIIYNDTRLKERIGVMGESGWPRTIFLCLLRAVLLLILAGYAFYIGYPVIAFLLALPGVAIGYDGIRAIGTREQFKMVLIFVGYIVALAVSAGVVYVAMRAGFLERLVSMST